MSPPLDRDPSAVVGALEHRCRIESPAPWYRSIPRYRSCDGPRLAFLPAAPVTQRLHHRPQLAAALGEDVLRARRMLGVEAALDDAVFLQLLQPRRQGIGTRADEG